MRVLPKTFGHNKHKQCIKRNISCVYFKGSWWEVALSSRLKKHRLKIALQNMKARGLSYFVNLYKLQEIEMN